MKKIIAFLLAFLLVSCATRPPLNEIRTFYIASNYDDAFKSCIDYCSENSYPIVNADKSLGFINTGYKDYSLFRQFKLNFNLKQVSADSVRGMVTVYVQYGGDDLIYEGADVYQEIIKSIKRGQLSSGY